MSVFTPLGVVLNKSFLSLCFRHKTIFQVLYKVDIWRFVHFHIMYFVASQLKFRHLLQNTREIRVQLGHILICMLSHINFLCVKIHYGFNPMYGAVNIASYHFTTVLHLVCNTLLLLWWKITIISFNVRKIIEIHSLLICTRLSLIFWPSSWIVWDWYFEE